MRRSTATIALSVTLLLLMPEGPGVRTAIGLEPFVPPAAQPRSTTVEAHDDPVVVEGALSSNAHGWGAGAPDSIDAGDGLSAELLAAYSMAVAVAPPGCHLSVPVLAAIGQVESESLAGHRLDAAHRAVPDIVGPALDGSPFETVEDTDGGRWDGDKVWDHAVGPMQFIPSSWRVVGVDMDRDGVRDPQDIYDAAGAAMAYLCADGRDLATAEGLRQAVLAYNHSLAYLEQVLAWKAAFDLRELIGWTAVPLLDAGPAPTSRVAAGLPARSGQASTPRQPPAQAQLQAQTHARAPAQNPTPAEIPADPLTGPRPTSTPLPSTTQPPPPPSPPTPPAEPRPEPGPTPAQPSPVPPCPPPVDPTIPEDPSAPPLPEPVPPEPSAGTTALPAEGTTEGSAMCLPASDPAAGSTTAAAPSPGN
jgi:hypothetical protein